MVLSSKLSSSGGFSASLSGTSSVGGALTLPSAKAANYEELKNLPKINDVELIGNKDFDELGMSEVTNIEIDNLFRQIF